MGVPMGNAAVQLDAVLEIPDKLYFRIGEVSHLTGVKSYVLRYWENEFPTLSPKKSGTNHRLYRRKDVETVLEIKRLLYDKRYTIEGARNLLSANGRNHHAKAAAKPQKAQGELFGVSNIALGQLRLELQEIVAMLR